MANTKPHTSSPIFLLSQNCHERKEAAEGKDNADLQNSNSEFHEKVNFMKKARQRQTLSSMCSNYQIVN